MLSTPSPICDKGREWTTPKVTQLCQDSPHNIETLLKVWTFCSTQFFFLIQTDHYLDFLVNFTGLINVLLSNTFIHIDLHVPLWFLLKSGFVFDLTLGWYPYRKSSKTVGPVRFPWNEPDDCSGPSCPHRIRPDILRGRLDPLPALRLVKPATGREIFLPAWIPAMTAWVVRCPLDYDHRLLSPRSSATSFLDLANSPLLDISLTAGVRAACSDRHRRNGLSLRISGISVPGCSPCFHSNRSPGSEALTSAMKPDRHAVIHTQIPKRCKLPRPEVHGTSGNPTLFGRPGPFAWRSMRQGERLQKLQKILLLVQSPHRVSFAKGANENLA